MKKLLSIFLSFSLIFSLVTVNDSLGEKQIAFAEGEKSSGIVSAFKDKCGEFKNSCKLSLINIWALFEYGVWLIIHVISVVADLFTNYKDKKIEVLKKENTEYKQKVINFMKVLRDNENNKNYYKALLDNFEKATDTFTYIEAVIEEAQPAE